MQPSPPHTPGPSRPVIRHRGPIKAQGIWTGSKGDIDSPDSSDIDEDMVPVVRRGSPPRQKPQNSRTCSNAEGEAVKIQNLQLSEVWNTPQGRKINEWIPAKRTGRDFNARLSRETGWTGRRRCLSHPVRSSLLVIGRCPVGPGNVGVASERQRFQHEG